MFHPGFLFAGKIKLIYSKILCKEKISLPFATQKKLEFMEATRNVVGFILDVLVDSTTENDERKVYLQ